MIPLDIVGLKHIVLLSIWIDYLWEQYLCARQVTSTLLKHNSNLFLVPEICRRGGTTNYLEIRHDQKGVRQSKDVHAET